MNPLVSAAFQSKAPKSLTEVAAIYQAVFTEINQEWNALLKSSQNRSPRDLADKDREQLRLLMYGKDSPGVIPAGDFKQLDRPTYLALMKMNESRLIKQAVHPGAPQRAMVVRDKKQLFDSYVHIRGDKRRRGRSVPRQFLKILAGDQRQPFEHGAGRLELAEAIVDPDNPLTARVLVNRLWHYHFGKGLVTTPSDFGLQTSQPVQQALLDYLAKTFIEQGWSIKQMHRLIMNSATYQQTSVPNLQKQKQDPENKLFWRYNRRRLEFEAIRDSLLAVTDTLDSTRGGPAVEMIKLNAIAYNKQSNWQFNPYRRTVYGVVARENLPTLLFTFDFADPDSSNASRNSTTVPTQSLYMMNSAFIMEMASALISRADIQEIANSQQRVSQLFQIVYNREPSRHELTTSLQFLEHSAAGNLKKPTNSSWHYGYASYNSKQGTHDLTTLKEFSYNTRFSLQGSRDYPDKKNGLGWLKLTANGGHAGGGRECLVCRWTSPADGTVSVTGTLKHTAHQGDGVRATLYSPKEKLGQWEVHKNQTTTNVDKIKIKQGEQLNFVVDFKANGSWDGYQWIPTVLLEKTGTVKTKQKQLFSSKQSFPKPQSKNKLPIVYGPWERYAQVLLMANEFLYIE